MKECMNIYSIRDLENLSGIKAHTIRIWEKRYGILSPGRTDSNIRSYNESELKKILNIAYLNSHGYKISSIAGFSDDELSRQVVTLSSQDDPDNDFQPGKILMSAIRFDEKEFIETLQAVIKDQGLEKAFIYFLNPLIEKSRILWQTGSLSKAQEQFIQNTIKQIIIEEDNHLTAVSGKNMPVIAMINPCDNISDISFLFCKYVLKNHNFDVIFTGGTLPLSEIKEVYKIKPFRYLVINAGEYGSVKNMSDCLAGFIKSNKIKKIIFTDCHPEEEDNTSADYILFSRDPESFIRIIQKHLI
ncbi:MAG TPA: MerR family transcriptional regulator [Bacteroidales bacterium]|nr:MerR family transcriptional regulator [Bacteroidales bacterium]HPI68937.1 MerR family transcriptional regulator [Bacteroidales bacterium]